MNTKPWHQCKGTVDS